MSAGTPSFVKPRPVRLYPSSLPLPDDGEPNVSLHDLLNGFEETGKVYDAFVQDLAEPE